MRVPTTSAPTAEDTPLTLTGALAELRRTAPETRTVFAGLLLVLGAWVGPGLQRDVAVGPETEAVARSETAPAPLVGGEAYTAAVRTVVAESADRASEPTLADED